MSSKNDHSICD